MQLKGLQGPAFPETGLLAAGLSQNLVLGVHHGRFGHCLSLIPPGPFQSPAAGFEGAFCFLWWVLGGGVLMLLAVPAFFLE